jgi:acyl-CoA reductase-like NAD-dependent aldehyde dehydrogenase
MTVAAPTGLDLRALLTEGTHLIGGEWVPARSGETFDVINPATQDVLLPVPRGSGDDIDDAAAAAAAAFPPWRDTSPAARAGLLYRWAALCREHEAEITTLESMEVGLSVLSFSDEEEAIAIANGTRYGLNASVWTSDVSRAIRLARGVQAGQVTVNGFGSFGVIGAPWGGYKSSGFGRTMSAESVLDYTQLKTVILNTAD